MAASTLHARYNGPGEFTVQSEDGTRNYVVRQTGSRVMVTNSKGTVLDDKGPTFGEIQSAMTRYTIQQRQNVERLSKIRDQIRSGR